MNIMARQRRIREVGRIRLGVKAESGAPRKIDRPRFTSRDKVIIEAVAATFGGTVNEWTNGGVTEWEVIIDRDSVPIMLPPDPSVMAFSQHGEQWARGLCTHRCNGTYDTVRDCPCDCDPDDPDCSIVTRLSVFVPDVPGFGVWRIDTKGFNAGAELETAMEMFAGLVGAGVMIPARLRLDKREKRKLVDGDAKTYKFVVPVIDLDVSINQLQSLSRADGAGTAVGGAPDARAVEAGSPPSAAWKPVNALPAGETEAPVALSVSQQLADAGTVTSNRRKGSPPLPSTGRTPAKATGSDAKVCGLCGKPFGGEPVKPNRNPAVAGRFVHTACLNAASQAMPEGAEEGGGEGTDAKPDLSSDVAPSEPEGEPLPAAPERAKMPTAKQHSAIFGLLRDVMPVATAIPGATADEIRREYEMALCAAVGTPGLTSHKEITYDTASLLIDALVGIKDGTYTFEVPAEGETPVLVRVADGGAVDFGEPFS